MSKITENIFKDFQKYLDEHSGADRSQADVERLMRDFMSQYNAAVPAPVTAGSAKSSDDYLELAYEASRKVCRGAS